MNTVGKVFTVVGGLRDRYQLSFAIEATPGIPNSHVKDAHRI